MNVYEIKYDNNSSYYLQAASVEDALTSLRKSIQDYLPNNIQLNAKVVSIRNLDFFAKSDCD